MREATLWVFVAVFVTVASCSDGNGGPSIDLSKLTMQQLVAIKQQFVKEERMLSSSYSQLRTAASQFQESRGVLKYDTLPPFQKRKKFVFLSSRHLVFPPFQS